MPRILCACAVLLAATALTLSTDPVPIRAAQPPEKAAGGGLAGNWKLTVPLGDGEEVLMLISFAEKDGKWTAEYLGSSLKLDVKPVMTSTKVTGEVVEFTLGFNNRELLSFNGTLGKDKKKLNGSISIFNSRLRPTTLYPTKLAKLDDEYAVARETLTQSEDGLEVFAPAFQVLAQAGEKKLPVAEAREIVDRLNKISAIYGPRWERDMTLQLVELLNTQDGFADLALAQARRAERLLTDEDTALNRIAVLEALARTLKKAGKADEAKPVTAQLAKLEIRDFAEYSKTHPPFKVEPFAGRKAKSEKAAVLELFTGAECPPCVAADLACDAIRKAYKPSEAIVLQYHLHVPRPDPLTSPDSVARSEYYADFVEGTPTLMINGKLGTGSGGGEEAAEKIYKQLRDAVSDVIEKPAGVKLALTVTKGEKGAYSAKAAVSDLDAPGEKMTLRFVLAEERVRFVGGTPVRFHHMVVRSMPGGPKGFALTKKSQEQTVAIDPETLRAELTKYLDNFAAKERRFPRTDRPLALNNLKLVALVQNDATKEILHAVQVDLEAK